MTEEARMIRNAYHQEYYRKNKSKAKSHQVYYWEKKALNESESSGSFNTTINPL